MANLSEHKPEQQGTRVFIKDGFRSYRRTYDVREVYAGAGVFVGLLALLGWVSWKGAHPDPRLFDISAALSGGAAEETAAAPARALPAGLGDGGFRAGRVGEFSADNLYVKINGRAGFFQSFGVQSLRAVTLAAGPSEAPSASVDIELYDLGEAANALGAYDGERPPEIQANVEGGDTFHIARNAGFLARGRHYVRLIGSDESPEVIAEVRRLLELFRRELPGETRPWAFSLFVDQLKLSPSAVGYVKHNAFSFGFARDVFTVALSAADSADDVEAFVSAAADPGAARALAKEYAAGFASLGVGAGQTASGVPVFRDEFLGTYSAATATERWVVGMRGAPDADAIEQMLGKLAAGIAALPSDVRARAVPSPDADVAATPAEGEVHAPSAAEASGTPAPVEPVEPEAAGSAEALEQYEEGLDEY